MGISGFQSNAENFFKYLEDSGLGASITYKQFVSTTYNTTTGQDLATYTSTAITAQILEMTPREIEQEINQVLDDDLFFGISVSKVSQPTKDDQIVYNSDTYEIVNFNKFSPLKRWRIHARRIR